MTKTNFHKLSRFTEYYALNKDFDSLYYRSKQGCKNFNQLYNFIFSKRNICLAYRNIKSNRGSMTPGTDGINIVNIRAIPSLVVFHTLGMKKNLSGLCPDLGKYEPMETIINRIQSMAENYKSSTVSWSKFSLSSQNSCF